MPDDKEHPELRLNTGPLRLNKVVWDRQSRSVAISWAAETEVVNVIYVRFVAVGFSWPPVRWVSSFMSTDDED